MIIAKELRKVFKVHKREPGFRAALSSLFRRRFEEVVAVDNVSFEIADGERVGFLGPNGAGKTTTLKLLSGLLHPTSGTARVLDFIPSQRPAALLQQIALIMGQKQQLLWDLPPGDTFEMNRAIYGISSAAYRQTVDELVDILDLGNVITKPTRQLSLGERMKCELVAALIHQPKVLFLDEPTIGLDVSMQVAVRDFIRDYNQRHQATVMLTSHYMADVAALCPRVIVINKGRIIHDGDLRTMVRSIDTSKRVSFAARSTLNMAGLAALGEIVEQDANRISLRVVEADVGNAVSTLLRDHQVADLAVEDPPLEDVMRQLFGEIIDDKTEVAS
jgi:ABC-2 type transport system ATP-binding protein